MKQILVTGANGQLGNEMRHLAVKNPTFEYIFAGTRELDVTDRDAIMTFVKNRKVNCIVNCAAYTAVDKAEEDKERCRMLNALAPGYLAEAAQENGAHLIHISTDYVFNGEAYLPYIETDAVCPKTVYGQTKLEGEQLVLERCEHSMIFRTAWLYSSFGNNFVKTMLRLGCEKSEIGVVFDQIGTPTYAHDLAGAIFVAINKGIVPGVYHFSNEGVCSWYDFAKSVFRLAGIETCKVRPLHTNEYPAKALRPHYSVLDKTKIKQTFGMQIPHWEESLARCLKELV